MCDESEWSCECDCSAQSNRQAKQEQQQKITAIVSECAKAGLKIVRASELGDGEKRQK